MSQTPQRPDRATDNDFDDIDVPAYRGNTDQPGDSTAASQASRPRGTDSDATTRWYQRAGRAAPQSIPPTQGQPTTSLPAQPTQELRNDQTGQQPSVEQAPTTVQGATTGWGDNGRPATGSSTAAGAYQDPAPAQRQPAAAADSYADQDFAPTTVTPAHAPVNDPAPAAAATGAAPAPVAVAAAPHPDEEAYAEEPVEARRGTIDLGIFIIRVGLAAWLIIESIATFFQLGGNEGLSGLEAEFAGYAFPSILALAVPTTQLAAGLFLLFGLVTPLFAAVATVVTGFTALHALASSGAGLNVFAWPEGVWLSVILLVISVALQFTGPGLYSLDFGRRWARRPLASSWIFIILAIAGVVAVWWLGTGINPFA